MHSLITFATQWGSKLGGINSFNTDFLEAFGVAYGSTQVICIVSNATHAEIKEASNSHVILLPMRDPPQEKIFSKGQAQVGIDLLKHNGIDFKPECTLWLGHDRITGEAAVEAARIAGGRSALIHHMSYDHYEAFAENSQLAYAKNQEQRKLFEKADLILAIGPLLRDAAKDLVGESKTIHMLIPGLPEIEVRSAPKTFTAFLSGRMSADAARIKQSHLGIAAFAHAHQNACKNNMPDGLCAQPKLMLRGVDYAVEVSDTQLHADPEVELKAFAESYAGRAINLQALPYIHDRDELYDNIRRASVALMPSWHEGFGLVAWEAIAAGVPLVISKHSGVYRFLEETFPGSGTGCVYPIDVRGSSILPFFRQEDLNSVAEALTLIAHHPEKARQKAGTLRSLLISDYTWSSCVVAAVNAFGWSLHKGSIPAGELQSITPVAVIAPPQPLSNDFLVAMPIKHWQAGTIISDSQLLRAEEALVPFSAARQPELDKLDIWLDDTQFPHAVRLVIGAGGLGKTRMALHLCEQRNASGWHAGFLVSEFDKKNLTADWLALQASKKPLLIVVDYAETRQDDLLALIKCMLQSPTDAPVRFLLLARDGGEWWDSLPAKNQIAESLLSGYATTGPYRLPPLHEKTADRQHAYEQALNVFAMALGVSSPNLTPELMGEHFGRPLYLQMAALLALRGERPTTAQGLTRALLNHERRYWRGLFLGNAFADPEYHAEKLLALTTLSGGFATLKSLQPYWKQVRSIELNFSQVAQIFHGLTPLYPGKQGLEPVRPDLLGEALVAQALQRDFSKALLDAVLGKDAEISVRSNALTVLARLTDVYQELHETLILGLTRNFTHCWQQLIVVAVETPSNLPTFAEAAFNRLPSNIKNQIAGLIEPQINNESIQLAELYCLVSKSIVDKRLRQHLKKTNDIESIDAYACALRTYSNSLSSVGRDDEALPHAKQALELHMLLARKNSDRFDPQYAASLGNYSNHLGSVARIEEALEHGHKALNIRERLARKNPDRFERDHSTSLTNSAKHLGDAGRFEEALDHAGQALAIDKRLARKNPDIYEPDYAISLGNYANHLTEVGRFEEALEHAKETLELRERLVQKNPDRFALEYADSLGNYANHLMQAGRNEGALAYSKQSLEMRELLVRKNPDRFESDYALSLNNYGTHLSDVGLNEEALDHGRKALELYERLVQKNSDLFQPYYVISLRNYSNYLRDSGCIVEALGQVQQALEIDKQLVQKNPDRFESSYASSLRDYAGLLSDAGHNEEALVFGQNALEIYQRLAQKNSTAFEANWFETIYVTHFQKWIATNIPNSQEFSTLQLIPESIPTYRRKLLLLYSSFVQACLTSDLAVRSYAFKQVTLIWSELSQSHKITAQDYWMCAAAWCNTYEPSRANSNWQTEWHKFKKQRQGHVPHWMLEVARRLKFKWPE